MKKRKLPTGIENFEEIVEDYYYVDKTLLIRDFLDIKPMVSLFTRPRRFGKSVMANMIGAFFGNVKDSRNIFKNLAILYNFN